MPTHGDDLEDDFVLDESLVALSDGEQGDLVPASTGSEFSTQTQPGKRKRKQRQKERKTKKTKLDKPSDPGPAPSFDIRTPEELSQYFITAQSKSFPKLSPLELEQLEIPGPTVPSIADTTSWTSPRTIAHLIDFIVHSLPPLHTRLSQRSKANGSPTLLFISPAALRVVDITRVLKSQKLRGDKGGEVAKLFARHIKLADHVAYLKSTKIGTAVGTPGRIGKLLAEPEALSISALSHIILDLSFFDAKQRNLLDIPETRDELFRTVLAFPPILKAIKDGKVQVVAF